MNQNKQLVVADVHDQELPSSKEVHSVQEDSNHADSTGDQPTSNTLTSPKGHFLTPSDLQTIQDITWEARTKWYQIGIRLGMSADDLDTIRRAVHNQNDDDYFTDMLIRWLRRRDATRKALADALRSVQVGYPHLADLIDASSQVSTSAGLSTFNSELSIASNSSIRKCEGGEIGFMCGCSTPCSIIDYLDENCPSSPKLFPFLNHSMLTKSDQNDLEEKLRRETGKIVTKFTSLTKRMNKSFKDQSLDPNDVIISVLGIAQREPSTCSILDTLEVEKDTTISEVIIHLQRKSYISFFNYHIVEYLITEYGTDEDKDELDKYITHFKTFCQRSIFEVPHHIYGQPPKDSKPLAIKVMNKDQWSTSSSKTSNFSLGDAKIVQMKVAETLGLRNYGSLPLLGVSEGCVVLTFALPTVIMESVKPKLGTITNIETEKFSVHTLCTPPGKPFAIDITSDSITLQWTKPEYEGTHSLSHYLVYYRSLTGSWKTKKKVTVIDASKELCVTLDGLSHETDETSSFIFKIEAVSNNGANVESSESDPIQLSTPLSELESRLELDWKMKSEMPFGISVYPQMAVLKEKVYIGGGNTSSDKERHEVIAYDPKNDTYEQLAPYTCKYFAMAVVGDELVLIGGEQDDNPKFTNQLGVWNGESLEWTHPLPPMSTACKCPSVTTYKNTWLVVIGGFNDTGALSRVEILDISSQQWFNSAPMVAPCYQVSLATIGNMCYLMGGLIENKTTSKRVYSVHIDHLISQTSDTYTSSKLWKTLPDTPLTRATALAFKGALLAVGGMAADIYMFQPSSESWVNVGRLRIARSACACTVLSNGDVVVAGGTGVIGLSLHTEQKLDIGTLK